MNLFYNNFDDVFCKYVRLNISNFKYVSICNDRDLILFLLFMVATKWHKILRNMIIFVNLYENHSIIQLPLSQLD